MTMRNGPWPTLRPFYQQCDYIERKMLAHDGRCIIDAAQTLVAADGQTVLGNYCPRHAERALQVAVAIEANQTGGLTPTAAG